MDRESLRSQAASRRSGDAVATETRVKWHCDYCTRDFTFERAFMNHVCKEKQRAEELRSPIGQAAYACYSEWMRVQRHTVPPIETFAESKFYATFIRFAEYAKRTNLPDVNSFIKLMVDSGKVPPGLWCRDNVYSMYIKAFDAAVTPETQFLRGIDELQALAAELKVELKDVFPAIGFQTLMELVSKRKLTSWLLLASDRFKAYLLALEPMEKDALAMAINVPAAIERFQQEPYLLKEFSQATKELGL